MKIQTILGTLLVGFGAALVGFVFGPIIKQAMISPHQRGEITQYQQSSPQPYRVYVEQPIQPQVAAQVQRPVQAHVPPNAVAPRVAALPTPAPKRIEREVEQNPMRRSLPPVADRNSAELPIWETPSPQQLPQLELPQLELPQLELPKLEAPVANWREELPQGEYSPARDRHSVPDAREVPVRRLPSHQVPTVRGVTGYESTSEPEAPLSASRIPQRATRAIRIENAGYEQRGRYEPETIEQMSFTATASKAPEMRSIRDSSQNQFTRQIKPVVGRSVQQSPLQRLRVSPQIEKRVAKHIQYGESLTRRQSFLAAREEFTLALLLAASSHKTASNPQAFSDCLAEALTALGEANDFAQLKRGGSVAALTQKIMSHRTRLISPQEIQTINPTKALDLYCGFAQSQLEKAIGYSVGGSQALHAMGKLETLSPQSDARTNGTGQARALVFFRAAMSVDPSNAVCSNDLGVLLYDLGRLREAEESFKVSLGKSQSKLGWENLAMVHGQMASAASGEERNRQTWLANLASKEAQNFAGGRLASPAGDQWASAAEFENRAAFPSPVSGPTASEQRPASPVQSQRSAASSLLQKVKGWY